MDYFDGCSSIVEARRRRKELALQYHPDTGGVLQIMQEVNRQFDLLMNPGGEDVLDEEGEGVQVWLAFNPTVWGYQVGFAYDWGAHSFAVNMEAGEARALRSRMVTDSLIMSKKEFTRYFQRSR